LLARLPKRQWVRIGAPIAINKIAIPNNPEKPFVTSRICVGTPASAMTAFALQAAALLGSSKGSSWPPAELHSIKERSLSLQCGFTFPERVIVPLRARA